MEVTEFTRRWKKLWCNVFSDSTYYPTCINVAFKSPRLQGQEKYRKKEVARHSDMEGPLAASVFTE